MTATTVSAPRETPDVDGKGFSGVLVDDVEHLQPALVGGLVELEVQRPHMIRILGAQPDTVRAAGPAPLPFGGWRPP